MKAIAVGSSIRQRDCPDCESNAMFKRRERVSPGSLTDLGKCNPPELGGAPGEANNPMSKPNN
jgi:hypothetical protein